MNECERGHGDVALVRCAHFQNRFVVEIAGTSSESHFIDYVEDMPDGSVVVEGYWVAPERQPEMWALLNAKMLEGEPPYDEMISFTKAHEAGLFDSMGGSQ